MGYANSHYITNKKNKAIANSLRYNYLYLIIDLGIQLK